MLVVTFMYLAAIVEVFVLQVERPYLESQVSITTRGSLRRPIYTTMQPYVYGTFQIQCLHL